MKLRVTRAEGIARFSVVPARACAARSCATYAREPRLVVSRRRDALRAVNDRDHAASGGCASVTITVNRPCRWAAGTVIVPARTRGTSTSPPRRSIGRRPAAAEVATRSAAPSARGATRRRTTGE